MVDMYIERSAHRRARRPVGVGAILPDEVDPAAFKRDRIFIVPIRIGTDYYGSARIIADE
jgi:hypothetical protein